MVIKRTASIIVTLPILVKLEKRTSNIEKANSLEKNHRVDNKKIRTITTSCTAKYHVYLGISLKILITEIIS